MTALRAVFFDLDGTLVDSGVTWRLCVSATAQAVAERCDAVDQAGLEAAYYRAATQVWEVVKDGGPPAWGSMDGEEVVRQVWSTALTALGKTDEYLVTLAAESYRAAQRRLGAPAYGDAEGCLRQLRGMYHLGVITNGPAAVQLPKLAVAELGGYFGSVTTTDIGAGKPGRRIFEHALAEAQVGAAEAAYVGDSLTWDVGGARDAGMTSVWLNRKGATRGPGDAEPDVEIATLAELPRLVADLGEQRRWARQT